MAGQKKGKKGKIILFSILGVLLIALVLFWVLRPKEQNYTEETVKQQDISTYYSFSGNISAKEKQIVLAETMTQIKSVEVKKGEQIKKGDVLFKTVQGQELKAKLDGEVGEILVNEGETCMAGTQLTTVTDYRALAVSIKIDEYDISAVTTGKEVTVHVNALEQDFSGTVSHVSKEAETVNGVSYFTADIDLKGDNALRVGMSTEVRMLNQEAKDAVTISMKALKYDNENKPFIYCRDSEGKVIQKSVTVGINDGTTVEIKEGLQPNDVILIPKGSFTPFDMMAAGHNR